MVGGGHAPYSPGLSKQNAVGIANISQHCRTGNGVLFNMENAIFWPILLILSQIYALFGVLFQAYIMRWCTKIDKYDVGQWAHYY